VVISNTDPFESVKGNGIRKMRNAGIEVVTGILENEGEFLNRRFFTFHRHKRPYIVLKFARSADGFIAPDTTSKGIHWISGPLSRKLVHKWRTEESAIMVGSATALQDNPQLTARDWPGKSPLRIVVDREGKLPARLHLFDGQVPTLVFTSVARTVGHNLDFVRLEADGNFIRNIFTELHRRNILSVMVEGGRRLIDLLYAESLWDEARIFTSPVALGSGTPAPSVTGQVIREETIGSDSLSWMIRK
jgi:diaminohydroxyphosphoribosylaminopyrimidine deaminase/5-amino-6-(5-phosphoribosylamino)uracil reductase